MKSDLEGDDVGSIDLLSSLTVFLCSCCCAALLMGTEGGQEADAASGVSARSLCCPALLTIKFTFFCFCFLRKKTNSINMCFLILYMLNFSEEE